MEGRRILLWTKNVISGTNRFKKTFSSAVDEYLAEILVYQDQNMSCLAQLSQVIYPTSME